MILLRPFSLFARLLLLAGVLLMAPGQASAQQSPAALKVTDDGRRLVTDKGEPFFWLGDTAWELFHRLDRDEAEHYLEVRAEQGFTVVQAVALAEMDGLKTPNAYGHLPFVDFDPARPAITEGPNNDYWDHVDFIVEAANERGLTLGFLPTWGSYWHDDIHEGRPLFNRNSAEAYGKFLGERYKQKSLVWIVGGDRTVDNQEQKEIIRAMARGLRAGDGGAHLITFHPRGGHGSAEYFHDEQWLDFNMRQNGHGVDYASYANTRVDYDRTPLKPIIDGEPIYEDIPIGFRAGRNGHSLAIHVRRAMYWDLFAGACGHTYGHHSVWQMWTKDREPRTFPLMPWRAALQQPGARDMLHGRRLIESRPQAGRIPDKELIVPHEVQTAIPGAGRYQFVATRAEDGSYAMVYAPASRSFRVRTDQLTGDRLTAWWYNPRSGEATKIDTFKKEHEREFSPPDPGEELDWVLVVDDAAKGYGAPGK